MIGWSYQPFLLSKDLEFEFVEACLFVHFPRAVLHFCVTTPTLPGLMSTVCLSVAR